MFLDKVYYDENNNPTEIQIICNKCGKILSIESTNKFKIIKSDYCILKDSETITCDCNNSAKGKIEFKKNVDINEAIVHKLTPISNKPKCPTCSSTNLKKISMVSKAGSIALWGVFAAGRTSKTWHCNNCGSEW